MYFPPWQQSCGQDLGGQQHQKSLFRVASFELEMICKLIQHNLNGWHLHCSINHFKLVDWDQEGIVKSARPCHFSKVLKNRLIYEFHQCLEVFQFRVEFPLKFNFQPFVWESMITICEILFQQWFSCSDDKSEGVNVIENRSFHSAVLKGSWEKTCLVITFTRFYSPLDAGKLMLSHPSLLYTGSITLVTSFPLYNICLKYSLRHKKYFSQI